MNNNHLNEIEKRNFIALQEDKLLKALKSSNVERAEKALRNGANIMQNNNEPFQIAVNMGNIPMIEFLLKNGAQLDARNNCGIKSSCFNGNIELAKWFVKKGVSVAVDEHEPLRLASMNGHIEVVEFLLSETGNNPKYIDFSLTLALKHQQNDLIKELIKYQPEDKDYRAIYTESGTNETVIKEFQSFLLAEKLQKGLSKDKKTDKKNKI